MYTDYIHGTNMTSQNIRTPGHCPNHTMLGEQGDHHVQAPPTTTAGGSTGPSQDEHDLLETVGVVSTAMCTVVGDQGTGEGPHMEGDPGTGEGFHMRANPGTGEGPHMGGDRGTGEGPHMEGDPGTGDGPHMEGDPGISEGPHMGDDPGTGEGPHMGGDPGTGQDPPMGGDPGTGQGPPHVVVDPEKTNEPDRTAGTTVMTPPESLHVECHDEKAPGLSPIERSTAERPQRGPGSSSSDVVKTGAQKKSFHCEHCKKSYATQRALHKHSKSHSLSSGVVEMSTTRKSSISAKKILKSDAKEKMYSCDECDKKYSSLGALTNHRKFHKGESLHQCLYCTKVFANPSLLKIHENTHTGNKPYTCPECKKSFTQKGNLKVHMRKHTGERPYLCSWCDKSFSQQSGLNAHQRLHTGEGPPHMVVDPEKTNEPDRTAGTTVMAPPESLHVECHDDKAQVLSSIERSTAERPQRGPWSSPSDVVKTAAQKKSFHCEHCKKSYASQHALHKHAKSHSLSSGVVEMSTTRKSSISAKKILKSDTKEKMYPCDECDKKYSSLGALTNHRKFHKAESLHQCLYCTKVFANPSLLKIHENTHTGNRPYTCPECKKSFTQEGNLKVHMRKHTGERPYLCSWCDKRFSQQSGLNAHQRLHTGEKPYFCDICDKVFTQKSNLDTHKLQHTFYCESK